MTIREFIQNKLTEIEGIEITSELPDELLEDNKTYFSYSLMTNNIGNDYENNATNRVSIIGYIKKKNNIDEDILDDIDNAQIKVCKKLKEINFKSSYNDVSISNNVRKIRITAYAIYNEINNGLI